jgi:N-acetylneuraminic acid mutarotase
LPTGAVVNNEIYILGGLYYDAILSENMSFNPTTYTWKVRASMPTPRYDLCCAVVDGKIYAIGGCGYDGECSAVEEFDPITRTWEYKADMPTARTGPGCAVFNGKIYVIGGRDRNFNYLSVNECYDPLTNTWTTVTPMPTPRCYPACVELEGLIYVISGLTTSGEVTANEAYDPIKDTWYVKAPIPTPRKGPAFGVINGKIYVAGGSNASGYLTVNEEYSPDVAIEETKPKLLTKINNIFVLMTSQNIIIKSSDSERSLKTITLYNAAGQLQDKWVRTNLTDIKLYPTKSKRFAKGTYFISIETAGGTIKKKVNCLR